MILHFALTYQPLFTQQIWLVLPVAPPRSKEKPSGRLPCSPRRK